MTPSERVIEAVDQGLLGDAVAKHCDNLVTNYAMQGAVAITEFRAGLILIRELHTKARAIADEVFGV